MIPTQANSPAAKPHRIGAIVLAAGESSRMGSPKPLLKINDETFVDRIVATLKAAGIKEIVLVLGHNADLIKAGAKLQGVEIVINQDYRKGQFSSLLAGLRLLAQKPLDGALVWLVDHPAIPSSVIRLMMAEFYLSKKAIIIPKFGGRRGHPVIFGQELFSEILSLPPEESARAVLRNNADKILEVECDEEAILWDIDSPSDYESLLARLSSQSGPE